MFFELSFDTLSFFFADTGQGGPLGTARSIAKLECQIGVDMESFRQFVNTQDCSLSPVGLLERLALRRENNRRRCRGNRFIPKETARIILALPLRCRQPPGRMA